VVLTLFIFGLVLSGITAFPLRWELDTLASWLGVGAIPLVYCLVLSRKLKKTITPPVS
jgi:hypothetical protein